MTEQELSSRTRLSVQRALLGEITPHLRMVTIGWEGLKVFKIRAYFDILPNEDLIEDINVVSTQVIADIPFETDQVECIYSTELQKDLEIFKHIVYSRKEI